MATETPRVHAAAAWTITEWLVLGVAALGFAFDAYEWTMMPTIMPSALAELLPGSPPGSEAFVRWRGLMILVPTIGAGVFGLLGGYLTDAFGRRRVLTWSILLYAVAAFAAGFATSMPMLLVLRTITVAGTAVEYVAALAWISEVFPKQPRVLAYAQVFTGLGAFLFAGVWILISHLAKKDMLPNLGFLPPSLSEAGPSWRYALMSSLMPALPLLLIRPFLPESPEWKSKKDDGTLSRPKIGALFGPKLLRTSVVVTVLLALAHGLSFGVFHQMSHIVPGLHDVKAEVSVAAVEEQGRLDVLTPEARTKAEKKLKKAVEGRAAGQLLFFYQLGHVFGSLLLASLVSRALSRRNLLRIFQVASLVFFPLVFAVVATHSTVAFVVGGWKVSTMQIGVFLCAVTVFGQYSFWGNYLPTVFPVELRGTGLSLAAHGGGRILSSFSAILVNVMASLALNPGADDPTRLTYAAAAVAFLVSASGLAVSSWLPEPAGASLRQLARERASPAPRVDP